MFNLHGSNDDEKILQFLITKKKRKKRMLIQVEKQTPTKMQTLLLIESLHCIQMAQLLRLQVFEWVLHGLEPPQPKGQGKKFNIQ